MKFHALALSIALTGALAVPATAQDDDSGWLMAFAIDGSAPKYPEGFEYFDYVNPDAPKGGTVRLSGAAALGSYDTFNPILPRGEPAAGVGLIYETLFTPSADELSTRYGLIAEAVRYPEDFSSVTFRLNPDARWADGEPITVEDVQWSFEKLTELNPFYSEYYASVSEIVSPEPGQITFHFDETGNRELPFIMSELLVLPRHWWEGTDADGEPRDIGGSTLEPPMGSGPYELTDFVAGRTVTYTRNDDYWAEDHPVNVGQNNFDTYRYEYFRDTTVMFEAFKADTFDWWQENQARRWATAYNFPAVEDGRVVREEFEEPYRGNGVMVGFGFNLRLDKFSDPRIREAINYAFDFQELNRTLFYGQYERIDSYFYGSDLRHEGPPEGEQLDMLEEVRDMVPASVFEGRYTNPTGGSEEALRENLRTALDLFAEAGYTLDGNRLVDANGEQFGFEILLNGPTIEPVALHLADNLNRIGADVTVRSVDSPQFVNRLRDRDFEVTYVSWGQSLSPGNEQRGYWGSGSADIDTSRNYLGISDPGIDALIDKIVFADDRDTLVAATKALDRVLLAHHFMVPSYAITYARTARWDRFGHPETLPEYSIGFPTIWWWDDDKAAATGGAGDQ